MCLSQNEPGGPRRCRDYIQNVENKVVAARQAIDFRKAKETVFENANRRLKEVENLDTSRMTQGDQEAYQKLTTTLRTQVDQLEVEIPQLIEEEKRLQKIASTAVKNHNEEIERTHRMSAPEQVKQDSVDENRPYATMSAYEFEQFQPTIKPGTDYKVRTRMVPLQMNDGNVHPYLTVAEKDIQFDEDRWSEALIEKHQRNYNEMSNAKAWNAPTNKVLQAAYETTNQGDNYVSQNNAGDGESTGDKVKQMLFSQDRIDSALLDEPNPDVDDLRKFATKFPGDSAYSQKIRTLASQDYVSYQEATVLASSISQWKRYKDKKTTTPAPNTNSRPQQSSAPNTQNKNEFVGFVGGKLEDTRMTVKFVKKSDSTFDPGKKTTKIIAQDTQGRTYTWLASNDINTTTGDEISLSGTIKDHKEYNGTKQTVITRGHLDVLLRH